MIKINIKDNLHNALTSMDFEWIPCTSLFATPLNSITPELICKSKYNSEDMIEIASIGYKYAKLEGVTIPSDLYLEAEAIGCEIDSKNPKTFKSSFNELDDIEIKDDFINAPCFDVIEETINTLHEKYDDKNVPIFTSISGPFTLLCQLYEKDIEKILKDPESYEEVKETLDEIYTAIIDEIKFYNTLDIDIITVNEHNATPTILEPKLFKELVFPLLEDLNENIESPSILHICGNSSKILKYMLTCGFEGINIDASVDINKAKRLQAQLNTKTRIIGNLSTHSTLLRKNPQEIMEDTFKVLENGVDILTPSCKIDSDTPLENINSMVQARNIFCEI